VLADKDLDGFWSHMWYSVAIIFAVAFVRFFSVIVITKVFVNLLIFAFYRLKVQINTCRKS